ncbi:hypothetical protein LCGC14_1981950 [marine sediment metagenome]|uniref:Uncharacterized protein n=1 Tax=marine sediment metagenome TaxID=412755 RepID=A0A0F9I5P0_9ZZZZ
MKQISSDIVFLNDPFLLIKGKMYELKVEGNYLVVEQVEVVTSSGNRIEMEETSRSNKF